jgi:hypothetical protein
MSSSLSVFCDFGVGEKRTFGYSNCINWKSDSPSFSWWLLLKVAVVTLFRDFCMVLLAVIVFPLLCIFEVFPLASYLFSFFIFYCWYWGLNSAPYTCHAGAWVHETLYQTFLCWYFWDTVSWTFCPGWLPTTILLISVSWVCSVVGMSLVPGYL